MTFCVTNALSFELDDANEAEPIRLGAPSAAVSVAPLKLDVLWNEAIIPGPFNTPAAASAGTRKAVIASERLRHRLRDHRFAAALFSIEKRGTTGVRRPIYCGRTTDGGGSG